MGTPRQDWPADTATLPPAPPPPPAPPAEPDPGNRIGLGMLLAIVVLGAVAVGLAALLWTRHHGDNRPTATPTTVVVTTTAAPTTAANAPKGAKKKLILPVPDLVGTPWNDSAAGLRRAGFKVSLVSVPSALRRGAVVAQDPKPGTKVAKGSDIRLKVSTGVEHATTTARQTTNPATPAATTPAATVQQQETTQATTTQATQPTTASVPSLSGDLQPAVQQLDQAGFKASVAYVPSDQPLGTLVAQTPSDGASAKPGSQVTVNVSSGPGQKPEETVPNLVGKRIPQALPALHAAGLRLIVLKTPVKDRSQAGVIVLQTPLPGKQAPKNAQVLVYYGAYEG
jgi:beta-lactam-binding protein with PASTA domain